MLGQMSYVFVTGGNDGIGFALCKQLAAEHGCCVFMGSRSLERGQTALENAREYLASVSGCTGSIELVQCDVSDDTSVKNAAEAVSKAMGGPGKLFAVVNNAGTGLQIPGVTDDDILNVNFFGPKRVSEAFLPLLMDAGATGAQCCNKSCMLLT